MDSQTLTFVGMPTSAKPLEIIDMFGRKLDRAHVKASLDEARASVRSVKDLLAAVSSKSSLRQQAITFVRETGDPEIARELRGLQDDWADIQRSVIFEVANGFEFSSSVSDAGWLDYDAPRFDSINVGINYDASVYIEPTLEWSFPQWGFGFEDVNRFERSNYTFAVKTGGWTSLGAGYLNTGLTLYGSSITCGAFKSTLTGTSHGRVAPSFLTGRFDTSLLSAAVDSDNDSPLSRAKNELQEWLQCNKDDLARLLGMTRQTLFTAGMVDHRTQPRIASKILDAHALISGFVRTDTTSRLKWIRGEGRRLWEEGGFDALDRAIMVRTTNEGSLPTIGSFSLDDADGGGWV